MSARTYLIVFITCDIIALVAQAIGGAMAAIALQNSEDSVTGTHIMVAGIAAQVRISVVRPPRLLVDSFDSQLASMLVFCVLALDFYGTSLKISPDLFTPKTNVCRSVVRLLEHPLRCRTPQRMFIGIAIASFWILVRCICELTFRLALSTPILSSSLLMPTVS